MVKMEDNNIFLTRGDSLSIDVTITDKDNKPVILPDDYTVTFTVKKHFQDKFSVLKKELHNTTEFLVDSNETSNLQFGEYIYDVQLNIQDRVYTVIEPHKFIICKEVGY